MVILFQLWHLDDSYFGMERYTCICDWNSSWNKRNNWHSCNSFVPNFTISCLYSQTRNVGNLVSGDTLLPFSPLTHFLAETIPISTFKNMSIMCISSSGPAFLYVLLQYWSKIIFYRHTC
jgi:hypothetical protein